MATKTCIVSFTGPSGIRHSVEVSAESLYEAAILGISVLRREEWTEPMAPGTVIDIQVKHPETMHRVTFDQLRRWANGIAVSPEQTLKKRKLKALLS